MKNVTILFVEDDPFLGLVTKDLLESSNYKVLFSKTAEEGLEPRLRLFNLQERSPGQLPEHLQFHSEIYRVLQ